jgi:hypothetical protein
MPKKLTYDFIKYEIEKEGYVLSSKEYFNNSTKLELLCPSGHDCLIDWDHWVSGRRCPYCAGNVKYTYDYVKNFFKKEGYTLLSKEYINANTKLDFVCPNGHKHSISWSMFRSGNRCVYCSKRAPISYEFVKDSFEQEGYTLLSKRYKNRRTKLRYKCPKGHEHSMSYNSWFNGIRCPFCSGSKVDYNFVKESFEKEGYTLLSEKYIDYKYRLKYKCPEGHEHEISWRKWKSGGRCPFCNNGRLYYTYEFVESEFRKEGYTLLSTHYTNAYTKLKYRCPVGHEHHVSFYNWYNKGYRCVYCSGKVKKTIEEIELAFSKEGYILLSKNYINSFTPLYFKCPVGHKHCITWSNWKRGSRCRYCNILNNKGDKHHSWRGSDKVAWYDTYADKLYFVEEIKRSYDNKNIMEVKCSYCGIWFKPTREQANKRYRALDKIKGGEGRFYCSESCKKACPIYNQNYYPRGFKPATSREVQPELRQLVLARDNYECQVCGKNQLEVELHCHHITGVKQNPIESADVDNCVTLCKEHHKHVHKQPGCTYHEFKCLK